MGRDKYIPNVGDIVYTMSGGTRMSIEEVSSVGNDLFATCIWFTDGYLGRQTFRASDLTPVITTQSQAINVGDVVLLKTGGVAMIVEQLVQECVVGCLWEGSPKIPLRPLPLHADCVWYDERGREFRRRFPAGFLRKARQCDIGW